ncbi:hypothetical protein [Streptomyces sp. DH24]|uniref:hypothetical protein n=1 Tax=Streptomyces sp. DH24 TaxID=3040123 RepID=UPI002442B439|nr:hypothetical protein [Streptomyces sp. DH24]MDG9716774.1 hypothetical protein [Streptomyces sp. DH24]
MNLKKIVAGSVLTVTATAVAVTPATADEEAHGHYSQSVQIIGDICPTIQDIDVLTVEVLDEARTFQCNEIRQGSKVTDESSAPALPVLGRVVG